MSEGKEPIRIDVESSIESRKLWVRDLKELIGAKLREEGRQIGSEDMALMDERIADYLEGEDFDLKNLERNIEVMRSSGIGSYTERDVMTAPVDEIFEDVWKRVKGKAGRVEP